MTKQDFPALYCLILMMVVCRLDDILRWFPTQWPWPPANITYLAVRIFIDLDLQLLLVVGGSFALSQTVQTKMLDLLLLSIPWPPQNLERQIHQKFIPWLPILPAESHPGLGFCCLCLRLIQKICQRWWLKLESLGARLEHSNKMPRYRNKNQRSLPSTLVQVLLVHLF